MDARFAQFVDGRSWVAGRASVVNQRHDETGTQPGELPDWDLGLNLELPDPGSEFPGETGVRVGFRSDIGRFSALVHSLATEDALCLIREMKLEKGEGGILNCELALSRTAA